MVQQKTISNDMDSVKHIECDANIEDYSVPEIGVDECQNINRKCSENQILSFQESNVEHEDCQTSDSKSKERRYENDALLKSDSTDATI